jgi:hypothetical protein
MKQVRFNGLTSKFHENQPTGSNGIRNQKTTQHTKYLKGALAFGTSRKGVVPLHVFIQVERNDSGTEIMYSWHRRTPLQGQSSYRFAGKHKPLISL